MKLEHEELTKAIIKASFTVHNILGAGFLEKVYHNAMLIELREMGLEVVSQFPADVFYKGHQVGEYYADLFVGQCILVELKAIENLLPIHETQVVNYLNAVNIENGLLINFGSSVTIKHKFRTYKNTNPKK